MRILQIVTLVSPDAAYGGPLRVAMNQSKALRKLGHEVVIAGGYRDYDQAPNEIDGTPLFLFRAFRLNGRLGFAGLVSPGLHRWLGHEIDSFDLVHVHLARDLVTLPSAQKAIRRGRPVVLQTHGMIDSSDRKLAGILDLALTRRVLRAATSVLYLTSFERRELVGVGAPVRSLVHLPNGVPLATGPAYLSRDNEALFLARLHSRKRPRQFVEAARQVAQHHPDWRFTLVGPDEGEGFDLISEKDARIGISWEGPIDLDAAVQRIGSAAIYVLPSVDEPFPMSVLEAMSVGTPVVVTDTNGLARAVAQHSAGAVTDGTTAGLASALSDLIVDPDRRSESGENARNLVSNEYSIDRIADHLNSIYSAVAPTEHAAEARRIGHAPTATGRRSLVIVQPYVPAYRSAFFSKLSSSLEPDGIDLTVISPKTSSQGKERGDSAQIANHLPSPGRNWVLNLPVGSLQAYGSARVIRSADAVVLPAAASLIDNYFALYGPGRSRRTVGLWGHLDAYVQNPNKLDRWLEDRLMHRADHLFAYTDTGKTYAVSRGIEAPKITTLNNTIDTAELRSELAKIDSATITEFRATHGIVGHRAFGYIGALDSSKNIAFLASLLDELTAAESNIILLVAGQGPDSSLLRPAIERGQVVMLGYADAATKALMARTVEALINPGRIGLIAVDAMSLGIPLLTVPGPLHAPEYDYLHEGRTLFTGPIDPSDFSQWLAGRRFAPFAESPPELQNMVDSFRAGVHLMLSNRPS